MDKDISKSVDELEEGEIDEKEDDGELIILDDSNESTEVTIIDQVVCSETMKPEVKKGRRTLLPDPVGVRKCEENVVNNSNKKSGEMNGVGIRAVRLNTKSSDVNAHPQARNPNDVIAPSRTPLQRKRRPQLRPQRAPNLRSTPTKGQGRPLDPSRTRFGSTIPVRTMSTPRLSYSNWKRTGRTFASRQAPKSLPNLAEKRNIAFRRREPSYDDLLAQYREIQSQLDDLSLKEGKSCNEDEPRSGIDDLGKENIDKTDMDYIDLRCDAQADWSARRERLPHTRRRLSSRSSLSSIDAKEHRKEDDDEELELRRIALNSTLQRKKPTEQENGSNCSSEQSSTLPQETLKTIENDNFEDVSVDLDSFPESPLIDRAIKIQKVASELDEDVDILRAMLLSSLSNKQLEKSTKFDFGDALLEKPVPVALKSVTPHRIIPQSKTVPILVPPTPVHDPVVIRLNEDDTSDSETDIEINSSKSSSLINSIDSFLIQARQKSEQLKEDKRKVDLVSQINQTPIAIRELPNSDIAEYYRLKAEISKREQSSGKRPTVSGVETVSKTDVIQTEKLNRIEKDLLKSRESMFENQKELNKVKLQMNNKMTVSKATETKITKLREQLAATIKIAETLESDMKKLQVTHDSLVKELELEKSKKTNLEKECLSTGKQLRGELYKLPQSPRVLSLKRKLISNVSSARWKRRVSESQRRVFFVTNPPKDNSPTPPSSRRKLSSEEVAREKARLKKMEFEVASKLQELRRNTNVAGHKAGKITISSPEKDSRKVKMVSLKRERRTSFVDRNPSTRPELTRSEDGFRHPGVSQDSLKASTDKLPTITLTEQQLEGFKKLPPLSEFVDSFSLDKLESVPLNSYDVHDIFHTRKLSFLRFPERPTTSSEVSCTSKLTLQQYKSPLLHFRTFRFSPYFRNKANHCLTWPTYSQKVSPNNTMCRFELPGTCNDDKCPWQHIRDYVMSSKEVLCDIVSYCPQLAGLPDGTTTSNECKLKIESYVDSLLGSNKDRMTLDQLCILTVGRVNETMGKAPPHYITFDDREWHPSQEKSNADATNGESTSKRRAIARDFRQRDSNDLDELADDGDTRYFSLNEDGVDVLESAVLEDPKDVNLWLRLAYKKLHHRQSSADLSLDMALNLLSRGLEHNQHNKELWLRYLSLYSKRKDCKDLAELCEQAVKFSPCYEVWWKCLEYAEGYVAKKEICVKMFDYVLKSNVEADVLSHQVVELVLYNVQLCILTGRCHQGQIILESTLGEEKSKATVMDRLVSFDRCILWLCYIHVLEFHCLPSSLFNPGNSGLGRVVCKLPFLLPWRKGHTFRTSLRDLVMTALRKCVQKGQSAKANAQVCLPLYRNLIALEIFRNKFHLAVGICQQLLKVAATNEVYVLLARLQSKSGDTNAARETLKTALKSEAASPYVFHFAAAFEMSNENTDMACTYIGQCASSMFNFSNEVDEEACICKPESFYRHVLGLPLALEGNNFELKVQSSYVAEQKLYIWLNYCIWLTAQNRDEDVRDSYESAIVQMTSASDLQIIWLHYLHYVLQRLAVSSAKQQDFEHLFSLVRRCISSVPCRQSRIVGCENKTWTDYNFFNKVVDLYVDAVDDDDRVKVYETFCSLAPTNACLVLRLLKIYMENGRYGDARYFARNRLETLSNCWDLWKVAIYLAKKDEHFSEVKWLYCEASKSLPYNIQVWKEFISFELSRGQLESAKMLIDRCRQLGVAIDGLLDSVLDKD